MPIRSLRALQSVTARVALLLNAQIGEPRSVEPLFQHPLAEGQRAISFVPIIGACEDPPAAVGSFGFGFLYNPLVYTKRMIDAVRWLIIANALAGAEVDL